MNHIGPSSPLQSDNIITAGPFFGLAGQVSEVVNSQRHRCFCHTASVFSKALLPRPSTTQVILLQKQDVSLDNGCACQRRRHPGDPRTSYVGCSLIHRSCLLIPAVSSSPSDGRSCTLDPDSLLPLARSVLRVSRAHRERGGAAMRRRFSILVNRPRCTGAYVARSGGFSSLISGEEYTWTSGSQTGRYKHQQHHHRRRLDG